MGRLMAPTGGRVVGKAPGAHAPCGKARPRAPLEVGQRGTQAARLVPELLRGRAGTTGRWSPRPDAVLRATRGREAPDPGRRLSLAPAAAPGWGGCRGPGLGPRALPLPCSAPCTRISTCWLPAPHSPCPHCPIATHAAPMERGTLPQHPPSPARALRLRGRCWFLSPELGAR